MKAPFRFESRLSDLSTEQIVNTPAGFFKFNGANGSRFHRAYTSVWVYPEYPRMEHRRGGGHTCTVKSIDGIHSGYPPGCARAEILEWAQSYYEAFMMDPANRERVHSWLLSIQRQTHDVEAHVGHLGPEEQGYILYAHGALMLGRKRAARDARLRKDAEDAAAFGKWFNRNAGSVRSAISEGGGVVGSSLGGGHEHTREIACYVEEATDGAMTAVNKRGSWRDSYKAYEYSLVIRRKG